ncbi:MAG: hypothetical protein MI755_06430 [Sphingomonadales bacterium]|nr:hypothetical protein [Sphingomonadales bacterium]
MGHTTHIFLHIVLFAGWFGAHLGVTLLLWQLLRPGLSAEADQAIRNALRRTDLIPRASYVLMLPMGLLLADTLGLFALENTSIIGAWLFAALWLFVTWQVNRQQPDDAGKAVLITERLLSAALIIVLVGAGILSLLGGAPISQSWLAWKVILYGVSLGAMVLVDVAMEPLRPALTKRPRRDDVAEPNLRPVVIRSTAAALVLYAALLGAAFIGVTRPL